MYKNIYFTITKIFVLGPLTKNGNLSHIHRDIEDHLFLK